VPIEKPESVIRKLVKTKPVISGFNLSWIHYLKLIRIEDEDERRFYEIEAYNNNWSVRELQRQYDSALYMRLVLSRDKNNVKELSEKGHILTKPKDAIKDPYILEFIGLPEKSHYSESDLGQMQMYVNYYDRIVKLKEENKTVGIILCRDKSDTLVEFTLPEDNEQIFASKYKTILPSKEDLKQLINANYNKEG